MANLPRQGHLLTLRSKREAMQLLPLCCFPTNMGCLSPSDKLAQACSGSGTTGSARVRITSLWPLAVLPPGGSIRSPYTFALDQFYNLGTVVVFGKFNL